MPANGLDWIGWLRFAVRPRERRSSCSAAPRLGAHGEPSLAGDLLVVASLITALAWILLSKKLMQTHSPPVVTAYTILSGTAMLAALVLGPWLLSPVTHQQIQPPPLPT